MQPLTPAARRALRARAHALRPVVSVGQQGLTAAVLHEIDVALLAHELIKIRVFDDERGRREALLARICRELDAAPVQHIGKLLVVWRPAPEREDEPRAAAPPARTRPAAARRNDRNGITRSRSGGRAAPRPRRRRVP
jgi:RNA-binding protein